MLVAAKQYNSSVYKRRPFCKLPKAVKCRHFLKWYFINEGSSSAVFNLPLIYKLPLKMRTGVRQASAE